MVQLLVKVFCHASLAVKVRECQVLAVHPCKHVSSARQVKAVQSVLLAVAGEVEVVVEDRPAV